jgi:hypothetical protein
MENAEIFYPYADTSQLGTDYSKDTPDGAEYVFSSIKIENNQACSIYSRVTMKSDDNEHFAQFEIAGVFMNKNGVISTKNQSDTTTNRDNDANYFRFAIDGTNINIICSVGLPIPAKWTGIIATISI